MKKVIKIETWIDEIAAISAAEKAKITTLKVVNAENSNLDLWFLKGYKNLEVLDLSENYCVRLVYKYPYCTIPRSVSRKDWLGGAKRYAPKLKTVRVKNLDGTIQTV